MEEQTSGMILRTRPLTETSLIVQWLTPDLGRIATVAKGARRPKSPFTGKLDLFYEGQFSFIRSRKSHLHALKEVVLTNPHTPLRHSYEAILQASYFGVLIEYASEEETPVPELWSAFQQALAFLEASPRTPALIFGFELTLLRSQGYEPDLEKVRLSADAKMFMGNSEINIEQTYPRSIWEEINRHLLAAVATSFERVPPQRQKALEIFGI